MKWHAVLTVFAFLTTAHVSTPQLNKSESIENEKQVCKSTPVEWICDASSYQLKDLPYSFRITLVTYAEPKNSIFTATQSLLNKTAVSVGEIDEIISWNWDKLAASEFWEYFSHVAENYPEFLAHKTAYWLWKPWIIRDALLHAQHGDFVVRKSTP
jgi:hypothetical protein